MADVILGRLIGKEAELCSLRAWLRDLSAEPQSFNLLDPGVQVTQGEFAAFVANYLRSQTSSFIGPKKCCQLNNLLKNVYKPEVTEEDSGSAASKISTYKENYSSDQKSDPVLRSKLSPHFSKYGDNFPELGPGKSVKSKKNSIGESSLEEINADCHKQPYETNCQLNHDGLLLSPQQKSKDLDQSQLSPYSPEYGDNFPELGSNKCRMSNRSKRYSGDSSMEEVDKDFNLLLIEESVVRKTNGRRSKRRIKPTLLNSSSCSLSGEIEFGGSMRQMDSDTSVFTDSIIIDSSTNLVHEREILKTERQKTVTSRNKTCSVLTSVSVSSNTSTEDVFDRETIQVISKIYSDILKYCLLPNMMGEIKFLLQLLLAEPCYCSKNEHGNNNKMNCDEDGKLFNSETSCIFFATEVIKSEFELLWCLDSYTLNLIASNTRITSVSKELSLMIAEYNSARVDSSSNCTVPTMTSHLKTITFQHETDKRGNFISDKSFRLFCKQRDLFYEIYQVSNFKGGNTMEQATLNKSVNHLVNLSQDPVNMSHLASLLVDQCISSVITQEFHREDIESIFPDLDHSKWLQLNKRLVQPFSEVPVNKEEEQFFKEFIYVVLNNRLFISILIQTIMNKIYDLSREITSLFDIGDIESLGMSSKLLITHHTLLLLGRLLGISLFGHNMFYPQTVIKEKLSSIWSLTSPSVDFSTLLEKSTHKGILVLTIPWMVECLLSIDPVSLNVPQNKAFIQSLISLYMAMSSVDTSGDHWNQMSMRIKEFDSKIKHINFTLTKVTSCAFNEIEEMTFKVHKVQLTECTCIFLKLWISKMLMDSACLSALFEEHFFNQLSSFIYITRDIYIEHKNVTLDCGSIINQSILNKYIPFLNHLVYSLNWKIGCNNTSIAVRHITPIKINHPQSSKHNATINLQIKLEDSFFSVHKGLKSTLDFIVERIANVCKSTINNNIMEGEKKKILDNMKTLKELHSKDSLTHELTQMINKSIKQMRVNIDTIVSDHCRNRIPSAISSLLSSDNGASFLSTCQKIATRKFKQQMVTWINLNIPATETLVAELTEVDGKSRIFFESQSSESTVEYMFDDKIIWSEKLIRFQEVMESIILNKDPTPTYTSILEVLSDIGENIRYGNLSPKVLGEIYIMTWDMVISLITNIPNIVTDDLLEYITTFWKRNHHGDVEMRILCARNIHMASKCKEQKTVSLVYAKLIALLVNKQLLKLMDVEQQALSLLRHTWQQKELQLIKNSMSLTRELLKDSPFYDDAKFSLLFEWIAEISAEIESECD